MNRDKSLRLALVSILTIALIVGGSLLVRAAVAVPATTWMNMFQPGDFQTIGDLVAYVAALRVPIPPVISALEIINVQRTGSTDWVTTDLYRISLVGGYVLALWLAYPSFLRMLASFVTALVFLWTTTLIHPSNPQVYDPLLPFFLLLFLALLRFVPAIRSTVWVLALAFTAGFFLSMAELTRPFVVLFLPFVLAGAALFLRRYPRAFLALMIPLVLLSGLWHLHLLAAHGQLLSTNYGGFNLRRAWPDVPLGPTVQETHERPPENRHWPNINTEAQYQSSKFLQRKILAYLAIHPLETTQAVVAKVVDFTAARSSIPAAGTPPAGVPRWVYPVVVRATSVFLLINCLALGWYAVRANRRAYLLLASLDNVLVLLTVSCVLVLSVGEAGEEWRLLISILPLLAAYPVARPLDGATAVSPSQTAA